MWKKEFVGDELSRVAKISKGALGDAPGFLLLKVQKDLNKIYFCLFKKPVW